ncbi:MAG: hypothetical protein KAG61_01030 [Bacteriovoracaceae bacterium]|nr:hypothetical protein [Bacteriovoracaceae bacterium]
MEKLLSEIAGKGYEVIAWNFIAGHFVKADVLLDAVVTSRKKELHFKFSNSSHQMLKEIVSGSGKINFFIPFNGLLFTSELKKLDDKKLITDYPTESELHDRRLKDRVEALEVKISIKIRDRLVTKSCFDLSSGGFSVVFMASENFSNVSEGEEVEANIRYRGETILLLARNVGRKKVAPYQYESIPYAGNRASFEFININAKERLLLNDIIETLR